jgi:hypothetical protein
MQQQACVQAVVLTPLVSGAQAKPLAARTGQSASPSRSSSFHRAGSGGGQRRFWQAGVLTISEPGCSKFIKNLSKFI